MNVVPTLPASRDSLPPEGAAPPAVRQSWSCSQNLKKWAAVLRCPWFAARREGLALGEYQRQLFSEK